MDWGRRDVERIYSIYCGDILAAVALVASLLLVLVLVMAVDKCWHLNLESPYLPTEYFAMMPMMRGTQYRQSLPGSSTSTLTASVLPSVPPVAAATRKRKREVPTEVVSYREEQYLDNTTGKLKNIIVIDDSPEPPPPATTSTSTSATLSAVMQNGFNHTRTNNIVLPTQRRTRAQVAAAAAAQSANQSAASSIVPPPAKRRKREPHHQQQQIAAAAVTAINQSVLVRPKNYPALQAKPWPSTSAATDVVSPSVHRDHHPLLLTFFG